MDDKGIILLNTLPITNLSSRFIVLGMSFELGSRVCDSDGFRGTVRYIGPVASAKNKTETWLGKDLWLVFPLLNVKFCFVIGIEWDDKTRGKHDGSVVDDSGNLHRHFECPAGAGSFLKPAKVNGGRTFRAALNERYVSFDAPVITNADSSLPGAFVTTSKGNVKKIELVGETKLRFVKCLN